MLKSVLILYILFFYLSCSSKSNSTKPQNVEHIAKDAFIELKNELKSNPSDIRNSENSSIISSIDSIGESFSSYNVDESIVKGSPGWIRVSESRIFSNTISPEDAKNALLQSLRNRAITLKVPETIEISTLLTDVIVESGDFNYEQTGWSSFFKSTISGIITSEKIILEDLKFLSDKNTYEKIIELEVFVNPVTGRRDPSFFIESKINKNLFNSGDAIEISIKSSRDSYLYIFNLMHDGNAQLIFPNKYMENNFLKNGEIVQIPNSSFDDNISFSVQSSPNLEITTESMYIVCTKERVKTIERLRSISDKMLTLSKESKDFLIIQKWLAMIPLDQRVEKNLVYHIIAKNVDRK